MATVPKSIRYTSRQKIGKKILPTLNKYGIVSIGFSADIGDIKAVKGLLNSGVDPNFMGPNKYTPLQFAIRNQHTDVVQLLLEGGANPNLTSIDDMTALQIAAASIPINTKIFELLLKAGADPNVLSRKDTTPLNAIIDHAGSFSSSTLVDLLKLLLSAGADPNVTNSVYHKNPIFNLVDRHDVEPVKILLIAGANPNVEDRNGNTLLGKLAKSGQDIPMFNLLLEAGADPTLEDMHGRTPLKIAYENGRDYIISLLQRWLPPDPNNINSISKIIINGYYYLFKKILPQVININMQDSLGNTALHYAIMYRRENMVRNLLSRDDIDINIKNNKGETPYFHAKHLIDYRGGELSRPDHQDIFAELLDEHTDRKLSPGSLGAKLTSIDFYKQKYPDFPLTNPEILSEAELEDLAFIFNLIGTWDSIDLLIEAIIKIQDRLSGYIKIVGSLDKFLISLDNEKESYNVEDIFNMSDESRLNFLSFYHEKPSKNYLDDLYFIAQQLHAANKIDSSYQYLNKLYAERSESLNNRFSKILGDS